MRKGNCTRILKYQNTDVKENEKNIYKDRKQETNYAKRRKVETRNRKKTNKKYEEKLDENEGEEIG